MKCILKTCAIEYPMDIACELEKLGFTFTPTKQLPVSYIIDNIHPEIEFDSIADIDMFIEQYGPVIVYPPSPLHNSELYTIIIYDDYYE